MQDHKRNKVILPPIPNDGDSRDSSLIVYTITVTIAIALFALTLTIPDSNIYCKGLNLISTIFLSMSTILTFIAIEYLIDITSFANSENNQKPNVRGKKYLIVLRFYNVSVIFIITAILLILSNYILALAFENNYYIENYYIKFSLSMLLFVIWILSTRKWWSDLFYLSKADAQ
jgi:hypothetical protein